MQDLGIGGTVVKSAISARTMTLSINQLLLISAALAVLYSTDVSLTLVVQFCMRTRTETVWVGTDQWTSVDGCRGEAKVQTKKLVMSYKDTTRSLKAN